jgi:hypothetical protein
MNRVLEVENYAVRSVESGIDEILGLTAGDIKTRPPHAIARGRLAKRELIRENACSFPKSGASGGGLDPSRYNERQCTFIVDFDMCIAYCESLEDLFCLAADRVAVVGFYPRFKFDLEATPLVRLNAYVKVGADLGSIMSRNARGNDIIHHGIAHSFNVLLCGPLCTLW